MESKIKEFTSRFTDNNWTTGNCYYFSLILKDRFNGEIYYDTIQGHFCVKIEESFYDYNGVYNPIKNDATIKWSEFDKYDSLQYQRIIRDCILQKETENLYKIKKETGAFMRLMCKLMKLKIHLNENSHYYNNELSFYNSEKLIFYK